MNYSNTPMTAHAAQSGSYRLDVLFLYHVSRSDNRSKTDKWGQREEKREREGGGGRKGGRESERERREGRRREGRRELGRERDR